VTIARQYSSNIAEFPVEKQETKISINTERFSEIELRSETSVEIKLETQNRLKFSGNTLLQTESIKIKSLLITQSMV